MDKEWLGRCLAAAGCVALLNGAPLASAQTSAQLTPACADAVRQAGDIMAGAVYTPDKIAGYDRASEILHNAHGICNTEGDGRLFRGGNHMLRLALASQIARLKVSEELVLAGADLNASWNDALNDERVRAIVGRRVSCESALHTLSRGKKVALPVAPCILREAE